MDDVTVFKSSSNVATWTNARFTTSDVVLNQGSTFSFSWVLANSEGLPIQVLEIEETVPFPFGFWDFLQYLAIKWDRKYQNFETSKTQQGDNDFRIRFRPRSQAELLYLAGISFQPVWFDGEPDGEAMYALIEETIDSPRWVYEDYPPIQSFRATNDDNLRVTQGGDVRVSNYSGDASRMLSSIAVTLPEAA